MQYIIGFVILIILIMFAFAIALWLLNFLLIIVKWISLVAIFGFLIMTIITFLKGKVDKKGRHFSRYLYWALASLLLFGISDFSQPKLNAYLTEDSNEEKKEEKKDTDIVASKQVENKDKVSDEEAKKLKEGEEKKKAEDKKKHEEEAKKKTELDAKKKAEARKKAEAEAEAKKPISDDFSTFDNPYDNMTDLQRDEFWKKVKGKYVQWTGEVVEVTDKSISVKCESDTFIDDFGATIIKEQRDYLININIGDTITIYGQLSLKEGAILSWQIDNAAIIE